jgi:hypothetical protein
MEFLKYSKVPESMVEELKARIRESSKEKKRS